MTERIPQHLQVWTVEQQPELYTPIDHAAWRYIMRISRRFFAQHAHELYLDGLAKMGISQERIPLIEEMDRRMQEIGWRAVAVSGFIPPQIFMEFQALGVLPIACDMRQLEHILYTPAPDVVHEAAGHAPIIADPDYSRYLKAYGEVSRLAIYSKQDMAIYRAIRHLSELKEDPRATAESIEEAEWQLEEATASVTWISEAAELSRMYWWTVEYGLVGELEQPKIYGAGLLSSAGESYRCLGPEIRKLPMSVDCVHLDFDITKPQPQLFVTPDFKHLLKVLEDYAETMACRIGGPRALEKARLAGTPVTVTLDSGLQISGVLGSWQQDDAGNIAYMQFAGSTMLGSGDTPLSGHGRDAHADGFGTAIGRLKAREFGAGSLKDEDLAELGFENGGTGSLEFESGVKVVGRLRERMPGPRGNRMLCFVDCRVTRGDELLFDPAWGRYDMACGLEVESVVGGWMDRSMDPEDLPGERPVMQSNLTDENRELCPLYQDVRRVRELKSPGRDDLLGLEEIARRLDETWPDDWLLRLELLELGTLLRESTVARLRERLLELADTTGELKDLVDRGLELC